MTPDVAIELIAKISKENRSWLACMIWWNNVSGPGRGVGDWKLFYVEQCVGELYGPSELKTLEQINAFNKELKDAGIDVELANSGHYHEQRRVEGWRK